jgi:hypothetical protein
MPEVAIPIAQAPDNPTTSPAPSPASYAPSPAAPRPGAISDDQFRRLDAGERSKYMNVRGANGAGGEWVPAVPAAPADPVKPAATNGAATVEDGLLHIGEMRLTQQDIQALMQTKAEADLRKTQIPSAPENYQAQLPEGFQLPDGMAFQFDTASPALADARRWAHANGLTQKQFGELLSFYASTQVADHQLMTAAAAKQVELLGNNSAARVSAVETFVRGIAGDELGGALRQSIFTAKQVLAWEKIISQFGSQGVASYKAHGREPPGQPGTVSEEQYAAMSHAQRLDYARQFDQSQFRNGR